MHILEFHQHAFALREAVAAAIAAYCGANALPWSRADFEQGSGVNLDDLATDALLYGAETFPVSDPETTP